MFSWKGTANGGNKRTSIHHFIGSGEGGGKTCHGAPHHQLELLVLLEEFKALQWRGCNKLTPFMNGAIINAIYEAIINAFLREHLSVLL